MNFLVKNLSHKLLTALLLFTLAATSVSASEIPVDILKELKSSFSNVTVRFDGLIQLQDGTEYLPVYPIEYKKSETPGKIVQTIPKNSSISSKPDLIMFDNNFSLLKIIRRPGQKPTLTNSDEVPIAVKLGLLPQDLLVPENLRIPAMLRVILGDLVIPVNDLDDFYTVDNIKHVSDKKSNKNEDKDLVYKSFLDLSGKDLYVISNNSSHVYVIDPKVGKPSKTMELKSIPSDIEISRDKRYILVSLMSLDKLVVIDSLNNKVVKEIPVGSMPSDIQVVANANKAFVSNRGDSSISVIDLNSMENIQEIKVEGVPSKLTISGDQQTLFYVDSLNGNIYKVVLDDLYKTEKIATINNVSALTECLNKLYVLSRTDNKLTIIDVKEPDNSKANNEIVNVNQVKKGKVVKEVENDKKIQIIEVGNKPVDLAIVRNKIYVLNAGTNSLSVIDMLDHTKIKNVYFENEAFPKNFNVLESGLVAMITNANAYEFALFDLETDQLVKSYPLSVNVNVVTVAKRFQKL